jgi:hypothetical protein
MPLQAVSVRGMPDRDLPAGSALAEHRRLLRQTNRKDAR